MRLAQVAGLDSILARLVFDVADLRLNLLLFLFQNFDLIFHGRSRISAIHIYAAGRAGALAIEIAQVGNLLFRGLQLVVQLPKPAAIAAGLIFFRGRCSRRFLRVALRGALGVGVRLFADD